MAESRDLSTLDPILQESAAEFLDKNYSNDDGFKLGIELEFGLLEDTGEGYQLVDGDTRSDILDELPDRFEPELGQWMIEAETDVMEDISKLSEIEDAILGIEDQLKTGIENADKYDVDAIRYGSMPVAAIDSVQLTEGERYRQLPEHHGSKEMPSDGAFTPQDFEEILPFNGKSAASINGLQANIQMPDRETAIPRAKFLDEAQVLAVMNSGNSGIINYHDTGLNDASIPIWSLDFTHEDAPEKVGPWKSYPESLEEYVHQPSLSLEWQDYIPEGETEHTMDATPYETANSENWKTWRFKDEGGNLVLESRLPRIQDSARHDTELIGFIVGLPEYKLEEGVEPLDAGQNFENYLKAMREGPDAEQIRSSENFGNAQEVFAYEAENARRGLEEYLGIEDDKGYIDSFIERAESGSTPGDQVRQEYKQFRSQGYSKEEAMKEALPKL